MESGPEENLFFKCSIFIAIEKYGNLIIIQILKIIKKLNDILSNMS